MIIYGVVHLKSLPGSPGNYLDLDEIIELAQEDVNNLVFGGVDGIIIENFGDTPFVKDDISKRTLTSFTTVVENIEYDRDIKVGINVLRNDGISALSIAEATKADFVRINVLNNVMMYTDQGMIEVIRDTVGRHDTFNYACTSKYYEDMGYFGHINCSTNFNNALKKYEVKPRKGWIAINLFFNTAIDANNVASFDEPWSRPGDYVLFRALKDLKCASSACPCDVDAANGWNPTDIFVRTYPKDRKISKGVAFRVNTDSEPKLTQETGFHSKTSKLTKNFINYNGYWLANNYTNYGAIKEYTSCRESAIVTDLSPLRKFEILGPDAENLMQYTLTRNVKKLSNGQVVYSAMCYENGCMIDDGTLMKFG